MKKTVQTLDMQNAVLSLTYFLSEHYLQEIDKHIYSLNLIEIDSRTGKETVMTAPEITCDEKQAYDFMQACADTFVTSSDFFDVVDDFIG